MMLVYGIEQPFFYRESAAPMTFTVKVEPNYMILSQIGKIMVRASGNNGQDNKKKVDFF
jgi:hypothetical protein